MKRVFVAKPIDIEPVDDSTYHDGPRVLQADPPADYEVVLTREGEHLNSSADTLLQVAYRGGQPGGKYDRALEPWLAGLLPSIVTEPNRLLFSDGTASNEWGGTEWLGQNGEGVAEYRPLTVPGEMSTHSGQSNVYFFSAGGDLFYVCEIEMILHATRTAVTALYRYQTSDRTFQLLKAFYEDVIDQGSFNLQKGSPVGLEVDGRINIYWRKVDRVSGLTTIVGYRSDKTGLNWTKVLEHRVFDAAHGRPIQEFSLYRNFRMRVCEGGGTLMFAYFGVGYRYRPDGSVLFYVPEFRTFISYDGGRTLKENEKAIASIDSNDWLQGQSLARFFAPMAMPSASVQDTTDWDSNFDMYYEREMGSFVIMKPGGPRVNEPIDVVDEDGTQRQTVARTHLMAIKTLDGDFTQWEPCAKLFLNQKISGITQGIDPWGPPPSFLPPEPNAVGDLFLSDLRIIEGHGHHQIVLCVSERSPHAFAEAGAVMAKFAFIDKSRIAVGDYEDLVGYGCMAHERYIFMMSPVDTMSSGLFPKGAQSVEGPELYLQHNPSGCRWRGQTVMYADKGAGRGRVFALYGAWSNLGETMRYQFSYSSWDGTGVMNPAATWNGLTQNVTPPGDASITRDHTIGQTLLTVTASGGTAYLATPQNTSYGVPERAGNSEHPDVKVKFAMALTGTSGWTEVLSARITIPGSPTSQGYRFAVRITATNDIELVNHSGSVIETFLTWNNLDPAEMTEYIVRMGRTHRGGQRVTIAYRKLGEVNWSIAIPQNGFDPRVPSTTGTGDPEIRIGILDFETFDAQEMNLRHLQMGTSSEYYRPIYSDYKKQLEPGRLEPMTNFFSYAEGLRNKIFVANPVSVSSNFIDLWDGSQIRIAGSKSVADTGRTFRYTKTPTSNSVSNLTDDTSQSVFDFTHLSGPGFVEIAFRVEDPQLFDTIAMFNLVGITGVDVRVGELDEDTGVWAFFEDSYYLVPYIELENTDIWDESILLMDGKMEEILETFPEHSLVAMTMCKWDGSDYTEQELIRENFRAEILGELGRDLSLDPGETWRIMAPSASFEAPQAASTGICTHVQLTLHVPSSNVVRAALGGLSIGRLTELTPYLDSMVETQSVAAEVISSDYGFDYTSDPVSRGMRTEVDLGFLNLGYSDEGLERSHRLLSSLSFNRKKFALIERNSSMEASTRMAVVLEAPAVTPEGYWDSLDCTLGASAWSVDLDLLQVLELGAPVIMPIDIDNANPAHLTSFTASVDAYDPSSSAPVLYYWTLTLEGDSVVISDSSTSTFTDSVARGTYILKVYVKSQVSNKITSRSRRIYVGAP